MTISARDAQWFPQHQQIKEILRMGYNHHNHHNWWQLVTLVMMVREYRRSNHNAISVITRHRQTRNSPWSSRLATISYLILTSHNLDAKFSVHPIAFHIIQILICISRSIHRWYIKKRQYIGVWTRKHTTLIQLDDIDHTCWVQPLVPPIANSAIKNS